jgi:TPR repeat protein
MLRSSTLVGAALLAALLVAHGPARAGAVPVVAVFEIEDTSGTRALPKSLISSLGDYLEGQLAEGGVYQVVPRETLRQQLAAAKKESYKSCFDDACQLEIGKAVAAEKTLSTRLIRIGEFCILKASMFDLRKEISDQVANTKTGCKEEDLISAVEEVARKLKGGLKVAKVEPPRVEAPAIEAPRVEAAPVAPRTVEPPAVASSPVPPARAWPSAPIAVTCGADACLREGYSYRDGSNGRTQDSSTAFSYFLEACRLGKGAGCTDVGFMFEKGKGVMPDLERGVEFYGRGCDLGNMIGCANLGYMHQNAKGTPQSDPAAAVAYKKACEGGEGRGCCDYGFLAENGRHGAAADLGVAFAFYQRACELKNMIGCANLGYMHMNGKGTTASDAQAAVYFLQACEGGEGRGCTDYGYLLENGRGLAQSLEQAAAFYRRGCDAGNAIGCANHGYMLEHGRGTTQDVSQARAFYQRACSGGNQKGCDSATRLR